MQSKDNFSDYCRSLDAVEQSSRIGGDTSPSAMLRTGGALLTVAMVTIWVMHETGTSVSDLVGMMKAGPATLSELADKSGASLAVLGAPN